MATSKPLFFAEKIVTHFKLGGFFRRLYGSELDGRRADKGELIGYILESEKIPTSEGVIIGDRKHDIMGAKKAGIASIGVTWGYGSLAELTEVGADHIFHTPHELRDFLKT